MKPSSTNDAEKRRRQIVYRANHRGIKEMDILLGEFATLRLAELSNGELESFEAMLEETDRDLLSWFTGEHPVPGHLDSELIETILAFRNERNLKS